MTSRSSSANPPAPELRQPREQLYRCRELLDIVDVFQEDADLWVFRRFTTLHLFNILHLQRRLSHLEKELLRVKDIARLADIPWGGEQEAGLQTLTTEIRETLKAYDEAISSQVRIHNHRKPRPKKVRDLEYISHEERLKICRELGINCRDRRARARDPEKGTRSGCRVKFWSSLSSPEADQKTKLEYYAKAAEGLASIAAVEKSWMHLFVDSHMSLKKMFMKGDIREGAAPLLIYSEKAIQRAEQITVNVGFCFLLICPIFLLSYFNDKAARLGIFVAFIVTGSVLTSGLIHGGNIGNLAVMAGYAAILVVFLSSGTNT